MIKNTDDNSSTSPSHSERDELGSNTGSYFDLYDLPASFHLDQAAVKNKYYELSRRYHPDRFTAAAAPEMTEALRMAAVNNDAYKTLKSPDATMAYILKINNLLEEEEKYNLPPAFLMEMMELNEAISDYEDMPGNENAHKNAQNSLTEQLQAWENVTDALTIRYDSDQDSGLLLQIKDMYFRKKYLLRIKERIDRFAAQL